MRPEDVLCSFDRKKAMKHFFFYMAVICLAISCGLHEIGGVEENGNDEVWTGPPLVQDGPSAPVKSRWYMVGVDYRDGYDWRADSEKGTVKCSLVVYSDGVPVMKIPVGDSYHVSSDPDMHRMVDGHLYTDYYTECETVIKKDGVEILRYPGCEAVRSIIPVSEGIYTLGQSRTEDRLYLRLDGNVVFEKSGCRIIRPLMMDGNTLCFSFSEPVASSSGTIERYYNVRDGKSVQVALRDDVVKVWDILNHNGETVYVASLTGIRAPVIIRGDGMQAMDMQISSKMLTCRLFPIGESYGVQGVFMYGDRYQYSAIWIGSSMYKAFDTGRMIASMETGEGSISCSVNPIDRSGSGIIFHDGEEYPMPAGYLSMGSRSLSVVNGILYAGLSSTTGGKPLLWKDSVTDTLDMNGYITEIHVVSQ